MIRINFHVYTCLENSIHQDYTDFCCLWLVSEIVVKINEVHTLRRESTSFRLISFEIRRTDDCMQDAGESCWLILRQILDQRGRPSVKISLTHFASPRAYVYTRCSDFSKVIRRKGTRPSNCWFTANERNRFSTSSIKGEMQLCRRLCTLPVSVTIARFPFCLPRDNHKRASSSLFHTVLHLLFLSRCDTYL